MNILVCVKEVPDTEKVIMGQVKIKSSIYEVPKILNRFDGYAMEAALGIKDEYPDTKIYVLSMGSLSAISIIRECLALGADEGTLVLAKNEKPCGTLVASTVTANAIREIENTVGKMDLIFCGKQAACGNTSQFPPELAEETDMAFIQNASNVTIKDRKIRARQENDDGYAIAEAELPCLVSFTKLERELRYPDIANVFESNKKEIAALPAENFVSRTIKRYKKAFTLKKSHKVDRKSKRILIREESDELSAAKLFEILKKDIII